MCVCLGYAAVSAVFVRFMFLVLFLLFVLSVSRVMAAPPLGFALTAAAATVAAAAAVALRLLPLPLPLLFRFLLLGDEHNERRSSFMRRGKEGEQ